MPEIDAKRFLKQIMKGAKYLYANGIIHRDLKPDNLIIDCFNNLKVIDFGISIPHNTVIDLTSISNSYTMKYVPVDLKFKEMSASLEESDKQLGIEDRRAHV